MGCRNVRGWPVLCLCAVVICTVWTLVLPWIGSRQSVHLQIEALERQGIDPAALFYSDLDAMERLESDVAAITRAHPEVFWNIGSRPSK